MVPDLHKINIETPRYDQNTYSGRLQHFKLITNPLNLLATSQELQNARAIVQKHRSKEKLPKDLDEEGLWRAKVLYDSAFHPDTGELMPLVGRMSAQVPSNMIITGGMLTFYQSTPAVIFWQWINQSFNAVVNYTNRSGDTPLSEKELAINYVAATSGALVTALGLNSLVKKFPPLVGRFVPFAAVAAANCVNIPLMRSRELKEGTPIFDAKDQRLGQSKNAAQSGIGQVIFSRILMAAPGMALTPFVMNHLERKGTLCRYPWAALPIQLGLVGFCLVFATPLACACFKQQAEFPFAKLEPELQQQIRKNIKGDIPEVVYYNKGL